MAITTSVFIKDSGSTPRYTRADLIDQMESALAWGGCHGPEISGLIVSLDAYSGGSTVAGAGNTNYMDLSASGGSGSGATFMVRRNSSGVVEDVKVSRPGSGYANNETLTLAAADFDDSVDLSVISCNVMGEGTPTGFGGTTTYFDKDTTGTYPWAVARRVIDSSKTYGDTYTAFRAYNDTQLYLYDGSSFHPENSDDLADDKHGYGNSFRGDSLLDFGTQSAEQNFYFTQFRNSESDEPGLSRMGNTGITVSGGTDKALNLNTYKSSSDTNFVVFSYNQPTRSSASISDNTYSTFFLHNFSSSLWDYNYLYLGGFTEIIPFNVSGSSNNYPRLQFKTYWGNNGQGKRAAMWGYSCCNQVDHVATDHLSPFTESFLESVHDVAFYARTENTSGGGYNANTSRTRGRSGRSSLNPAVYYNAVIKGIPLNAKLAPAPYYIPDDFVLINFEFHTTDTNFQQGDTITVDGTEVYTIITASYDFQTDLGMTRGIAFCGRTT